MTHLTETDIWNKAIDKCIKVLDTRHPQYHDVLNDRRDMIEALKDLKKSPKQSRKTNRQPAENIQQSNPIELSIQR